MTDALQNLIQAVDEYRGKKEDAVERAQAKSPYGQKIYDLNMEWAAKKKAAIEALAADEAQYKAEVEKFTKLHNAWASDNRQQTPHANRGRPKNQWPDEVKMAAAQAIRDKYSRTMVRGALGISNTARFNILLREGEELLQVQELKARDQKQDQATGEEW
jgi:hypothetical protein